MLCNVTTDFVSSSMEELTSVTNPVFCSAISARFLTLLLITSYSPTSFLSLSVSSFNPLRISDMLLSMLFMSDIVSRRLSNCFLIFPALSFILAPALLISEIIVSMTFTTSSTTLPDSSASFLTSEATTIKPFPCSPALAASMDALRDSRFVWEAI